ncbi:MAG: hypothetical protein DMG03_19490 [Acidobacteria bacterium]|nr:MAG: hypothetical protein DMG03_19490 [Acidobacteriota bacterium]
MKTFVIASLATSIVALGMAAGQTTAPTGRPRTATPTSPKLATAHASAGLSIESQNQLVGQYCATCHSDKTRAGGLSLAAFDAAKVVENANVAEKMIRKLRAGMMPPPQARRPDAATIQSFYETLENTIDAAAALKPNPGWRPFQRLNRAEYQRAVRDLLGIDVDVTAYLPPDTVSSGFDNVADEQTFSPALLEGYLRAASQISRLAVGDRNASATSATYKIGRFGSQMRQVDGAPIGTRGGISVVHIFPADGDYVIKASMHYEPLGGIFGRYSMLTMNIGEQLEVSINGERVALLDVKPNMSETDQQTGQNGLELKTDPIHIKAGPQRVTAAFIQKLEGPVDDLVAPLENTLADVDVQFGVTALPHMRDMTILGPSHVTGVSETVSRRKIFSCRPSNGNDEETCAAGIVGRAGVLPEGTQRGRFRKRRPPRASVGAGQPAIPVSSGASVDCRRAPDRRARGVADVADQRSGSCLAPVVLPLGVGAGCRARQGREQRFAPLTTRRREAGEADARGSAIGCAVEALREPMAAAAGSRQDSSRRAALPAVRRSPGRGDAARNGALLRQHRARRSERARSAHRRLRLRQRAARETLRHSKHHRRVVPARAAAGIPPRTPGTGKHPDADVGRGSHVAGAARQVGDGSAARHAAAAAAAERAGPRRYDQDRA